MPTQRQFRVQGKNPAVVEQATQFKLVAGDNSGESLIGAVKSQMRRCNELGRFASKVKNRKNLQSLAAAMRLRSPVFSLLASPETVQARMLLC